MVATDVRVVLLLQGPPSRFFDTLEDAFEARGVRCVRVNFHGGDWLRGRGRDTRNYRGRLENWGTFLERLIVEERVTDIIYYADRLPYHRVAKTVARRLGVTAHVLEFGYLRPDWLTLELGGMSAYSHLPADPDTIHRIAAQLPEVKHDLAAVYGHPFASEAWHEVTYNLAALFLRPFYPHYAPDRAYHPIVEYLSWLPQLARRGLARRRTAAVLHEMTNGAGRPFYFFPLQLQSDYQIRANSPFRHLSEAVEQVVGSFARHAPKDTRLLVKIHPLDNGLERWPRVLRRTAERHGVADRIRLVSIGPLAPILENALGTVLVNSTVGLQALQYDCPVKALGIAIYDMPGLTFQGPLDRFWTEAAPPDTGLRDDFIRVLAGVAQVKGSFYHPEGRRIAAQGIVERIMAGAANAHGAYVDPPPRLARARDLGIAVEEA